MRLAAPAWEAIAAAARAAYPEECCGLLIGTRANGDAVQVTRAVAAANVAAGDRRRRFEIDPRCQFATMRALRGTAEAIVGHYHSHPDGPPLPSAADRDSLFDPSLYWLIVGVDGKQVTAAAFRAEGGTFFPIALVIEP